MFPLSPLIDIYDRHLQSPKQVSWLNPGGKTSVQPASALSFNDDPEDPPSVLSWPEPSMSKRAKAERSVWGPEAVTSSRGDEILLDDSLPVGSASVFSSWETQKTPILPYALIRRSTIDIERAFIIQHSADRICLALFWRPAES